jgi:hypothetical protein
MAYIRTRDYASLNSKTISEYWIRKDEEGSGRGLNFWSTIPAYAWRNWENH